jgi:F-type H+-transporting ATPase subunit delta
MIAKRQAKRKAKQLFRFCLVENELDENRVRQVVRHTISAGYRDCPAILAQFLRLVRLDRTAHSATIESATPLPADLQTAIERDLLRQYGPGLTTAFYDRPSLIGGVRILVGRDLYDGSVLARLSALEKSF